MAISSGQQSSLLHIFGREMVKIYGILITAGRTGATSTISAQRSTEFSLCAQRYANRQSIPLKYQDQQQAQTLQ